MKFLLLCVAIVQAWDFATRLGSKTAYRPMQNASSYIPPPFTCGSMPVHAELVARHGIRYATTGVTNKLTALQNKLRALPSSAPQWVRSWTNPVDPQWSDMVTTSGQQEHYEMGKRFRKNYPSLFTTPYNPNRFVFHSTWVPRAQQSGMANVFGSLEATGSLGPSQFNPPYIYTHPMQNDTVLRFFDSCPKYDELSAAYSKVIDTWGQANLDSVLKAVRNQVSDSITYSDMLTMYQACGYEYSLKGDASQMCSLFDDTSMPLMDLFEEFDGYFLKGPGVELSYMIASPLMADILTSMKSFVATGSGAMYLRFAHAETISPLAAYMGLFAGGPPLAFDVRPSSLFNRSWDDALVMPYGANMLLLLYSCSDGYKVKMLYNEKETVIPGCDTLYCPWTTFYSLFEKSLSFDYYATCKKSSSTSASSSTSTSTSTSASSSTSASAASSTSSTSSASSASSSSSSSLPSSSSSSTPASSVRRVVEPTGEEAIPMNCTVPINGFCVPRQSGYCCKTGQCIKGLCTPICRGNWCRRN